MSDDKNKDARIRQLRGKLEELNRKAVTERESKGFSADRVREALRRRKRVRPATPPLSTPSPILYRRDIPRSELQREAPVAPAKPVALADAVDGEEVTRSDGRRLLLTVTRVDSIDPDTQINRALPEFLCREESLVYRRFADVFGPCSLAPSDFVFMDIETTGLSNVPLFLIGAMVWEDEGFVVRQYLARDYSEEASVIAEFADACAPYKVLVTFNGKSFDLPFIRTRAIASGVPFEPDPSHLDLLHESRRIWRNVLPNCRLQTLESSICGRYRHDDIPGSEIGEAYHAFVRSGNAWQIVQILEHNKLDLVTLADILTRIPVQS